MCIDRKLYSVIKHSLGEEYFRSYPDSQDAMIIVQKTVYLLMHGKRNKKINFAYDWKFWICGPYSSEISYDIYDLCHAKRKAMNRQLTSDELEAVQIFKEFKDKLLSHFGNELSLRDLMELISFFVYIALQINNFDDVAKKVVEFKSDMAEVLSDENIRIIEDLLNRFGYI